MTMLGRNLEQALFPSACAFCGTRRQPEESPICEGCNADLPWIGNACARCAGPAATALPHGVHCTTCQQDPPPFCAAVAPLAYAFPVDAAIKAMKFRRKLFYTPAFARILGAALPKLPPRVDALLPVPLHWRRQALRGFNQAHELARPLCKALGVPVIRNVVRARATLNQSGLAAEQRRDNLRGAFAVRGTWTARHVLIVDDVITTGATCRQLTRVVLDAGAEQVSILALARA